MSIYRPSNLAGTPWPLMPILLLALAVMLYGCGDGVDDIQPTAETVAEEAQTHDGDPADEAAGDATGEATDEATSLPSWPVYRGNTFFQGIADDRLSDSLTLAWTFTTNEAVKSSAVIGHGRAYIGSDDKHVYAIDLATGDKVWAFATQGPVEAPPLIVNDRIYIGSSDGNFYALDAHSGSELWQYETGDKILGSATFRHITDEKGNHTTHIIFGSYDFNLYCIDEDGTLIWKYETDNYVHGAPALTDDRIIVGGCDMLLHIISADTGEEMATVDLEAQITATVAIRDNRAYIGHYGNMLDCVDLAAEEIVWSARDRNFPIYSSAAVSDDLVAFGTQGRRVMGVNREDGSIRWEFSTRGRVDSSPVIAGDRLIVGAADGRLYLLDTTTGEQKWSYDLGQSITASPAVAGGMVVIGCEDGNVYAFKSEQ